MRFECIDSGIIVYTWIMKILGENWTHGLWKDNMRIYKYKCNTLKMTSEICVTMMMNKVLIFFIEQRSFVIYFLSVMKLHIQSCNSVELAVV